MGWWGGGVGFAKSFYCQTQPLCWGFGFDNKSANESNFLADNITIKQLIIREVLLNTHTHTNSISAISQLLLTRFWWNFKGRFLWTSRTDSNCQGDICPRNICPRDICPYQEYLSCYWPDFDETLQVGSWKHLEQILNVTDTFALATFVHIRNISAVIDTIGTKL